MISHQAKLRKIEKSKMHLKRQRRSLSELDIGPNCSVEQDLLRGGNSMQIYASGQFQDTNAVTKLIIIIIISVGAV